MTKRILALRLSIKTNFMKLKFSIQAAWIMTALSTLTDDLFKGIYVWQVSISCCRFADKNTEVKHQRQRDTEVVVCGRLAGHSERRRGRCSDSHKYYWRVTTAAARSCRAIHRHLLQQLKASSLSWDCGKLMKPGPLRRLRPPPLFRHAHDARRPGTKRRQSLLLRNKRRVITRKVACHNAATGARWAPKIIPVHVTTRSIFEYGNVLHQPT